MEKEPIDKGLVVAQPLVVKPPEGANADDTGIEQFFFEGGWRPDLDASEIGPDNYSVLENMMYSEDGPVAVSGYTKRTSTTSPFIT